VADAGNHRIQKFDSNGKFITKWRVVDTSGMVAVGLAIDSSGNIYLLASLPFFMMVPAAPSRVLKFTSDGHFITEWSSYGCCSRIQSSELRGVAVGSSGAVYFVEPGNSSVQKFSPLPSTIPAIPVLTGWGTVMMSVFLGMSAIYLIRKKRTV